MTSPKRASTPIAIYARYSTDRQDARSIEDQVRRCRSYATTNGHAVAAVYSDAAISGAHLDRADMQRMLGDAASGAEPRFNAVLVDDLSRLSRDLGATWKIIFEDLAGLGISVIDCTTGMASDREGARLTFGALALVNDTFLQLVRTETHRGLEGRALSGFWTGGRCFGYTTVNEDNPADPSRPRKRPVIDESEADLVRRVFRLFTDGMALKKIAALLNEEGIPAPHDGGKGNKMGRGWGHTTIRAMLKNERYIGRFAWNQSKWVRVPGKRSRRRIMRPKEDWIVHEVPELGIVTPDLWHDVQAKFRRYHRGRGRPAGTGNHVYLVSGLLRCGLCGGSMTVVGRKIKRGVRYATFGCTSHYSRGSAICTNSQTISERKASRCIVEAIKTELLGSKYVRRFAETFIREATERRTQLAGKHGDADRRVNECRRRIANLTESLAQLGWSDALAKKLENEETLLTRLKAEQSSRSSKNPTPAFPSPDEIQGYLQKLFNLLDIDAARGRAVLIKHLAPVVMTPQNDNGEKRYYATGAFNLAVCMNALSRDSQERASAKCRSGGEI